jgi:ElaB/YqjD/DUF883 family membrane-anchored ribosome-binding protein
VPITPDYNDDLVASNEKLDVFVIERPLAALAIAAVLGFLLARMIF